jgi:hypothetical protein
MITWTQQTENLFSGTIIIENGCQNIETYEVMAKYDQDCDTYVGWVTDMDDSLFAMQILTDSEFFDHAMNMIKSRWLE